MTVQSPHGFSCLTALLRSKFLITGRDQHLDAGASSVPEHTAAHGEKQLRDGTPLGFVIVGSGIAHGVEGGTGIDE